MCGCRWLPPVGWGCGQADSLQHFGTALRPLCNCEGRHGRDGVQFSFLGWWAGMAEGGEGKQVMETKPAPKAGHSLGLLQGPLQEGCSPRTNPNPTGRAGLSTCIQSTACVVGKEEVNTGWPGSGKVQMGDWAGRSAHSSIHRRGQPSQEMQGGKIIPVEGHLELSQWPSITACQC